MSPPAAIPLSVDEIDEAESAGRVRLLEAGSLTELRAAETEVLGRRAPLARLNSRLGGVDPDERRRLGALLNQARDTLRDLATARRQELEGAERQARLAADRLDLTETVEAVRAGAGRPGGGRAGGGRAGVPLRGHLNLVTQTRQELEDTFVALGFAVAEGPEVETDWYNFEALNMPPHHPARGLFDTFYLETPSTSDDPGETVLLRTHTSPTQIRVMQAQKPPIYAIMPGRCYRRDTADARHLPVFHQIEGLVVDEGITFGDLAGTIEAFTTAYFGPDIHSRLRPSYFPFTEPSAEFDVTCPICGGQGCRTCSGSGWIELGGCGLVDPNVFLAVGVDPEIYSGFAFGFGIDRLAQVRAQLGDMRVLLDNDIRFLTQF